MPMRANAIRPSSVRAVRCDRKNSRTVGSDSKSGTISVHSNKCTSPPVRERCQAQTRTFSEQS
jgi:hypothetical protein